MKKSLFLLLVVVSFLAFGQSEDSNKNFQTKEVTAMAVFPGCENFSPTSQKTELMSCMSNKLREKLTEKLGNFSNIMEDFNVNTANCGISFVIDKKGKIRNIKLLENKKNNYIDLLLGIGAEESFKQFSKQLPPIKPTKSDQQEVNLVFVLPVTFYIDYLEKPIPHSKLDFTEIVVYTLKSTDKLFEIRIDNQTKAYKVYEILKKKNLRC